HIYVSCNILRYFFRALHFICFFFSSRRRHTRFSRDWSSDVCSSDLWSLVCRSFATSTAPSLSPTPTPTRRSPNTSPSTALKHPPSCGPCPISTASTSRLVLPLLHCSPSDSWTRSVPRQQCSPLTTPTRGRKTCSCGPTTPMREAG